MTTLDERQGRAANGRRALAAEFPGGHRHIDTHSGFAAGDQDLPQANVTAMPELATPAGSEFGPDHLNPETQMSCARADQPPDGHTVCEIQRIAAVGNQAGRGQLRVVTHTLVAPATEVPAGHPQRGIQCSSAGRGPTLDDPLLLAAATMVDDLEKTRIAAENRLRHITRSEADSDGQMRGLAFGEKEAEPYAKMASELARVEHYAVLELQRRVRKHPLGPWIAGQVGVGEKQAARLLTAIGDPYWNTLYDRPRTVSELWAFAGYHVLPVGQTPSDTQLAVADGAKTGSDTGQGPHDAQSTHAGVAAARRRGQKANWSATAKMRTWIIASQCVRYTGEPNKNGKATPRSPYRDVYDEGREKYADAVHATPCVRCGPAGKPALAGSPLSDGHKHARAVRLASKAILRDLWIAARDIHEG